MLSYVPNDSIFSLAKERLRLQKASSFFPEGTGVLGYLLALPLGITDASTAGFVTACVYVQAHQCQYRFVYVGHSLGDDS